MRMVGIICIYLSFRRAARTLTAFTPRSRYRYTFWFRRVANLTSSSPLPLPGSNYSWSRMRSAMLVLWIPACPHYLYVSLIRTVAHYPLKGDMVADNLPGKSQLLTILRAAWQESHRFDHRLPFLYLGVR